MKPGKSRRAGGVFFVLCLTVGQLGVSVFASQLGSFTEAPCPFPVPDGLTDGKDLTCGYVVVPEYHARPEGRTLKLLVAKVSSLDAAAGGDPLVPLPTGPGSSAIDSFIPLMAEPLGALLRARRDVVIFEQRGLYYSEKNLVCREVDEWFQASGFEDLQGLNRVQKTADVYRACRRSLLQKDVDLNAYRYAESADDLIMIMNALGYSKFNALGVSAGTMLGQQLLKRHPERLRSVLINSVVRIDRPLNSLWPADSARHLERLFKACAADKVCNEAYPNLGEKLERTVKRLNANPLTVEVADPRTGKKGLAVVNGDRFAESVFVAGYSNFGLPALPELIHSVDAGAEAKLRKIAETRGGPGDRFAWGLGYSVFCSESPERRDEEIRFAGLFPAYEQAVANTLWGPRVTNAICALWGVQRVPKEEISLPECAVPTLLMSGEFDSISPAEGAAGVAQKLTKTYEVVVPGAGHSAIESSECPVSIALAFLEDPSRKPDTSCLAQLGIKFKLPAAAQ